MRFVPVVSVLVPAYEHEKFLAEALDSVLDQDFVEPFEVLIGEDQSTDGTLAVAERYARQHPDVVHVVTTDHNVGMHENYRRLLAVSRGQFIAFCEGDDYWSSPSKLRLQVEHLREHPDHVGVHSDVDHLVERDSGRVLLPGYWGHHRPDMSSATTFDDLLRENVVQTCSVMLLGEVARAFADSALGREPYAVVDWPLFLHSTMSGNLGFTREALATYRRVEGSATNQGAEAAERRIADQLRLLRDASAHHPHSSRSLDAGMRRTRWALTVTALRAGDAAMVRRHTNFYDASGARDPRLAAARLLSRVPRLVNLAGAVIRAWEASAERRVYTTSPWPITRPAPMRDDR